MITITLSAADATAHIVENPLTPTWLDHPMFVTLALLLTARRHFPPRIQEAITLAVLLVGAYLALNVVVVGQMRRRRSCGIPALIANWRASLFDAARQSR